MQYLKTKQLKKLLLILLMTSLSSMFCSDWDLGTDEDDPPAPVTLEIISVADTTVTLRWTQSQDEDFKNYKVYYSTSDIVDTTDKIADTLSFSYDTVKTVKPLDPEKHYYFRVIVSTYRNLISASNIVDTTTLKSFTDLKLELLQPDSLQVGESSVNLQWKKNWIEKVTRYFVYKDTSAAIDSLDTLVATIYDGEATTVTGLKRQKDYWFRVFIDRNGIPSAGSNAIKITTTSGVPKPVILDSIEDVNVKDTAVIIKWSKSEDLDFLRYVIRHDTIATVDTFTSYSSIDTASSKIKFVNGVHDTSLEISPLKRDTTYWFAVYVQDSTGFIKTSNKMSAKTKNGKPTGVVLHIDSTNDTSAFARWTMNTDGDFYRYVVYYNDTLNIDTIKKIDTTDTRIGAIRYLKTDTFSTILPLERNKKYWFVLYVQDATGFITKSNVDTAVTDDGFPTPVNLKKTNVTDVTISLQWDKSNDVDLKSYELYYDTIQNIIDSSSLNKLIIGKSTTDTTIILPTLQRYWFRIYTVNLTNLKSGSNIVYNYPIIIRVDSAKTNDTTIGFYWDLTFHEGSKFISYELYKSSSPNVVNVGIPEYSSGLIKDRFYIDSLIDSLGTFYYKLYENYFDENGITVSEGSNTIKRSP